MRECMEISAHCAGRTEDIVHLPDRLIRRGAYCFSRILQFECHYRQTLAKIVMDFRCNATAFSFLSRINMPPSASCRSLLRFNRTYETRALRQPTTASTATQFALVRHREAGGPTR